MCVRVRVCMFVCVCACVRYVFGLLLMYVVLLSCCGFHCFAAGGLLLLHCSGVVAVWGCWLVRWIVAESAHWSSGQV